MSASSSDPPSSHPPSSDDSDSDSSTVDPTAPPLSSSVRSTVEKIPLLSIRASPRDGDQWVARLKQELTTLIKYVEMNKKQDADWFQISPLDKLATKWSGKCWYVHEMHKYEFSLSFELPVTYPVSPFEIVLIELEGKTVKMYRGGKICLSSHFKPLWSKNVPHFGIAHALALGLGPWLAAEIPHLVAEKLIDETDSYRIKQ